ncbi:hypothetical protein FRC12_007888 [Ceratobasidium sp. 428]|nr:hypothetical protein FRC12_007888 [Ceratobasidium sp. 428]
MPFLPPPRRTWVQKSSNDALYQLLNIITSKEGPNFSTAYTPTSGLTLGRSHAPVPSPVVDCYALVHRGLIGPKREEDGPGEQGAWRMVSWKMKTNPLSKTKA